jgi:CHAT domain-containing protein/tetratricopeptide (TPR) repeat protein
MTLVRELLEARDLAAVRRAVARRSPPELRESVEPLAAEVLRMMRTDTRRALDVADRAVIVAAAAGDSRLSARATWMRGHGLVGALRNREAAECYASAAAAYREQGETLQEAKVAIGWITALMYLGEYAKALELGRKARNVLVRRGLLPEAARLDMNLGNIHHRVEKPAEALKQYDRALVTAKRLGDPVMIRVIQFNRANVLASQGRLDDAENIYRGVQEEAEAAGETRTAGIAEYSLGYLELLRGEFGRAYDRLESARTTFETLGDPHYLTSALTDLAELFVEMNGFRRAIAAGRQGRSLAERHGIRFEAGRCALFQAVANLGLDDLSAATAHLEDAARAFSLEGNRVSGSLCALYLAEIEARRGESDAAAGRLRQAAAVFAEEGLVLREAAAQARLAGVEVDRGDLRAADAAVRRARVVMKKMRAPWLRARIDHAAGRIALAEERYGLATRRLRRAVEQIESVRGRIGIDELRISFSEDKAPVYADLVHALLQRGGRQTLGEAFETVERARSRALVDLLAGRLESAGENVDPSVKQLLARLEKLRTELNWLSGFGRDPGKGTRDESRLRRSGPRLRRREEEIAAVVHRIQAKDHRLGALTGGETATLEDVRRGLGEATLVEYYLSAHGAVAFVVSRDGARLVRLPVGRGEIVERMSRARFQMEKWGYGDDYVRGREAALAEALDRQLRGLAERVWDPLHVEGRRVIVVPHGPLHSLPFHALPGADGRPLVEDHVFTWLPSASARRYLEAPAGGDAGAAKAAATAGGPGLGGARILAVGVSDDAIPQVDAEVRRVRARFRRGRLLRGAGATRARFLAAAPEADVVHVATHGVFREDDPHFSALRLADGWMSVHDLYGMRLDAGLVCLSACQSGRSWIGAGDELVGLARGFLHAGARNLVVSLWPVHDDSTVRLMDRFYAHLGAGLAVEEALRAAMLELRRELPHPYQWAPFVVIGRGGAVTPAPARGSKPTRRARYSSASRS